MFNLNYNFQIYVIAQIMKCSISSFGQKLDNSLSDYQYCATLSPYTSMGSYLRNMLNTSTYKNSEIYDNFEMVMYF
jgi:hypothetical protein